jgi:hypothetical protein
VKIVPPITITDAMLVSSNVDDGPAPDYNAGTTYAAGDVVTYGGTLLRLQYASIQDGNSGHTPGDPASEDWWRAIAYAAEQWDAGTTYAAEDGAQIDDTDVHQLWWSVVDDNLGNDPTIDAGDHWLLMQPTNRWVMFDLALGFGTGNVRMATRWGEIIDVTLAPDAELDTVVAFVLLGGSVRVSVADTGYDRTITLTGEAGRVKWQIDTAPHMHKVIFDDVDFTAGSEIRIRIENPGGIAACAELVLGLAIEAGGTIAGSRVGIQDYSRIAPDEFGTFQVTRRPWHQRGSFEVMVENEDVDPFLELLTLKRGAPVLFVGDPDRRSTIIFGIVRNFETVLAYPNQSLMSLDLESV